MGKAELTMIVLLLIVLIIFCLQSPYLGDSREIVFYQEQFHVLRLEQLDQ